jgi:tRNA (cytidine/uridine-2'-O-)-methyltransferase
VQRAGTRYWQFVQLSEYDSWKAFIADRQPPRESLYLFEEDGPSSFYTPEYDQAGYLVFGCESAGLPSAIQEAYADRMFHVPMRSAAVKSLNLSNVATAVMYQALRPSLLG